MQVSIICTQIQTSLLARTRRSLYVYVIYIYINYHTRVNNPIAELGVEQRAAWNRTTRVIVFHVVHYYCDGYDVLLLLSLFPAIPRRKTPAFPATLPSWTSYAHLPDIVQT